MDPRLCRIKVTLLVNQEYLHFISSQLKSAWAARVLSEAPVGASAIPRTVSTADWKAIYLGWLCVTERRGTRESAAVGAGGGWYWWWGGREAICCPETPQTLIVHRLPPPRVSPHCLTMRTEGQHQTLQAGRALMSSSAGCQCSVVVEKKRRCGSGSASSDPRCGLAIVFLSKIINLGFLSKVPRCINGLCQNQKCTLCIVLDEGSR